jgi:hypothetical protein
MRPMSTVDPIREALIAKPFRPFAMHLVDGTIHYVTHPDWVTIPPARRPRQIIYWIPTGDDDDYRGHWIDLGLVVQVVIPSSAPAQPATSQAG